MKRKIVQTRGLSPLPRISINMSRIIYISAILIGLLLLAGIAAAQDDETEKVTSASRLHPNFALLDSDGSSVLESGKPLSTMKTCGQCHDTEFIVQHSQHSQVALNTLENWNPIIYRYIDPASDMTQEAWIQQFGGRHAGGGTNPLSEMSCFLCHTTAPNNQARLETLKAGDFAWANSAVLLGTGIIEQSDDGFSWNAEAFDEQGLLKSPAIQDPASENCAQCHGTVHMNNQIPLTAETCDSEQWTTYTTGQIFSAQRMSASGLNLAGKEDLSRSWDIHAERMVTCVDCHYALNNPTYYKQAEHLDHLIFDPRRLDISEYLYRPMHDFASGETLSEAGAIVQNEASQPCEACHSIEDNHDWLPYKERHTDVLACETCHIPEMNAPALQTVDWTALTADSTPRTVCRGEKDGLIGGFAPVLLSKDTGDGSSLLAPYNLITTWYWISGEQPVPMEKLQAAWFDGENYHADVLAVFDADENGTLDENELLINTDEKESLIKQRLESQGLTDVQMVSEVQPFNINHGVTDKATRDCDTCHTKDSRLGNAIVLAENTPGGVIPTFRSDGETKLTGEFSIDDDGTLLYDPNTAEADLYVLGHNSVNVVDWLGMLIFFGTFAGVIGHGTLRYVSTRNHIPHEPELKRVYMYSVYERQWHWLQTVAIFILIFTGLIIHKPDPFSMFSFRYVVQVHNIVAFILVINAALAAFYHFTTGEIRQYLPRPYGFFDRAFAQAKYYLRGIFKGDPHPFEKTPDRKMNPLQQITYLGLLNVLLPLQIITGIMMWGMQHYPETAESLGGLPFLAPAHTMIAWLLASFIVMHVYLTTTGHQPLTNIKAMMLGWDEVEKSLS